MSRIMLDHVTKAYRTTGQFALRDLSLSVEQGEWLFLVGSSGAGKSTLLKLLYKGVSPDEGRVEIDGQAVDGIPTPTLRRRVGIIFQAFELLPTKTAAENVAYGAEVVGRPPAEVRERTEAMLARVGLLEKRDRFPNELSGGEQQRVAIARALVNRPRLILADEPTGDLDPVNADRIVEMLDQVHREWEATVLFTTHSAELVNRLDRRVVRLQEGRLVSDAKGGYWGAADSMPDDGHGADSQAVSDEQGERASAAEPSPSKGGGN